MVPTRRKTTKTKKCKLDPNVVVISSSSEDEDGNFQFPAGPSLTVIPPAKIEKEENQPRKPAVVKKSTSNNLKRKRVSKEEDEFNKIVKRVFPNSVETICLSDEEIESTTHCMVSGCKSEEDLMISVRFVYSYHQVPYRKENPFYICLKCDRQAKEAVKDRIRKLRNGELLFKSELKETKQIPLDPIAETVSSHRPFESNFSICALNPPILQKEESTPFPTAGEISFALSPPVLVKETMATNTFAEDMSSVLIDENLDQTEEQNLTITAAFSISTEIFFPCQNDEDICCDIDFDDISYNIGDDPSTCDGITCIPVAEIPSETPLEEISSVTAVEVSECDIFTEIIPPEMVIEEITSVSALGKIISPTVVKEPYVDETKIIAPDSAVQEISSAPAVGEPVLNIVTFAPETAVQEISFVSAAEEPVLDEVTFAPETMVDEAPCATLVEELFLNQTEVIAPETPVKAILSNTFTKELNANSADIITPETAVEEIHSAAAVVNTEMITLKTAVEETPSTTAVEEPFAIKTNVETPVKEIPCSTSVEEPAVTNSNIITSEIASTSIMQVPQFDIITETIPPEPFVDEFPYAAPVKESCIITDIIAPETGSEEIDSNAAIQVPSSEIITETIPPESDVEEFLCATAVKEPSIINTETITLETATEEIDSITAVQVPSSEIITETIPPELAVEEFPCSSAVEVPSSVIFTEIIPAEPGFEENAKTLPIPKTKQSMTKEKCKNESKKDSAICVYIRKTTKELLNKSNIVQQVQSAYSWIDENYKSLRSEINEISEAVISLENGLQEEMDKLYMACNPSIVDLPTLEIMDCVIDDELTKVPTPSMLNALSLPLPHAFMNGTYIMTPSTPAQINANKLEKSTAPTYIKVVDRSNKPKPKPGEKFLIDANSQYGIWIPGFIEQTFSYIVNKKYQCLYKVRIDNKNLQRWTKVEPSRLAFFEQYNIKLEIGDRVVAPCYISRIHGFYSGIIAELPTRLNKYRYLIFFEKGVTSYISPNEVHSVLELTKEPYEYFNEEDRDFIKSYVESYPSRNMIKLKPLERVKVKQKGIWFNARITEIDASIMKVLFLSTNHSEWIYRGSPRLYLVFEKLVEKTENPQSELDVIKITLPPSQPSVIEPLKVVQCEIISSDEEDSGLGTQCERLDSQTEIVVRAVAKKSVSRPRGPSQSMSHYTANRNVTERRSARLDNGRITRRYPPGILNPRLNKPHHACTPRCVGLIVHDEQKTKGMNPLAIPSVYAFKRDTDGINISYMSPCGKRLRSCEEVLSFLRSTELPLTIDLFDFDPVTSIFDEFIVSEQFVLMPDVSRGSEEIPIPCVNTFDHTIPDLMEYMTERRGTEGVNLNTDPNFLIGCDCIDNCQDKSKCACWQQTIKNAKAFNPRLKDNQIGYKNMKLIDGLTSGIFECNNTCKCCRKTCVNRVVQRPLKIKLQLFKTKKKGWGTRCVNDIAAGSFICVYVGNILTESYANETGRTHGDEYFAELDFIEVLEELKDHYEAAPPEAMYPGWDRNEDEDEDVIYTGSYQESDTVVSGTVDEESKQNKKPSVRSYYGPNESVFIMDAKVAGNIGRYLNHSCDPNIFVQNVFVDTHDLRFPWVSFFSMKHIPAGTELTWNYGYNVDSVPGKKLYCHCEAPNCKRRLL